MLILYTSENKIHKTLSDSQVIICGIQEKSVLTQMLNICNSMKNTMGDADLKVRQ